MANSDKKLPRGQLTLAEIKDILEDLSIGQMSAAIALDRLLSPEVMKAMSEAQFKEYNTNKDDAFDYASRAWDKINVRSKE